MHCALIRLIELNNLHNIVHRTPPQSKILATPLYCGERMCVAPYVCLFAIAYVQTSPNFCAC